ncbi:hypothetical protein CDD82_2284 [Ophiocordyceps australis]|uniref:SPX domain-containing protein n=1 Tax=Ophiocordyceps australis TaxID=1399860 RepID=A0A2C5ZV32_9HYPO|nr:hypothetical protein CDD82_2284 [Ophiocordyceps australis]
MKFAKELERDAVPEWRIKYLNYKAGKKYVKAIARAVNRTPAGASTSHAAPSLFRPLSFSHATESAPAPAPLSAASLSPSHPPSQPPCQPPQPRPISACEREALTGSGNALHYGSFVPPPALQNPPLAPENLQLPSPALQPPSEPSTAKPALFPRPRLSNLVPRRPPASSPDNQPNGSNRPSAALTRRATALASSPLYLRRIFSHASAARHSRDEDRFDLVRQRQRDFLDFMDSELDKVETFYKLKEEQAGLRLAVLRNQLHEMRNRRTREIAKATAHESSHGRPASQSAGSSADTQTPSTNDKASLAMTLVQPLKARIFPLGPNSKALRSMARTPRLPPTSSGETRRDYTRRPSDHDISYRTAKRKLKVAMHEFYRGLELLKSYALLNRTAFRKLNKKYDKALHTRHPLRYMDEKVSSAWFVNSDVLETYIKDVEDLYGRYFEGGNHKVAAGKLRSIARKAPAHQSGSAFINGFFIGTGIVFCAQGLAYAIQIVLNNTDRLGSEASYLLQLYAGYFLMLLLFTLFCLNCFIWTEAKINYPFIFEFDQRSQLDWRRLAEFPSFFLFLLGLVMWLNFGRIGPPVMFTYYPILLIVITALVILLPAPVLAHKSRKWFVYAHWRLLLAGLYPVEFRDFFLGDMYCSLTYSLANIELFFCLYAGHNWETPSVCNSSRSRLMGFFLTLPPIWRLFQCIRRYRDTRNVFPHLVNGGKYVFTITSSAFLSVYRIHDHSAHRALYITTALLNAIYVSVWDLFMDFSLLQAQSRQWGLRDILAFKRPWLYYCIMVVDPILRFSWVFYAIYTHRSQHSSIISFLVSLSEVIRRGMWALFRVENEHCANVAQYKASRDVPLPYRLEPLLSRNSTDTIAVPHDPPDARENGDGVEAGRVESNTSSAAVPRALATLRRRTDTHTRKFSKLMAEAHRQDFEKRRKPVGSDAGRAGQGHDNSGVDDVYNENHHHDGDEVCGGESDDSNEGEQGNAMVDEAHELHKRGQGGEV